MKTDLLVQFPMPWLPTVALVLFIFGFIGVLVQAFWPANKAQFQDIEQIPLRDERSTK